MKLGEELIAIQAELKAPKGRKNTFGNYNYRSCEDILEAVKPILKEHGCTLTLSDDIIAVGERIYVKATAHLTCDNEELEICAYAREAESKKGMDDSQITGTASSYARKYALNGLFLIDDTKDADTDEYQKRTASDSKPIKAGEKKIIIEMAEKYGKNIADICRAYKIDRIDDMTGDQYADVLLQFKKIQEKQNG